MFHAPDIGKIESCWPDLLQSPLVEPIYHRMNSLMTPEFPNKDGQLTTRNSICRHHLGVFMKYM